jgi:hypothetical protein
LRYVEANEYQELNPAMRYAQDPLILSDKVVEITFLLESGYKMHFFAPIAFPGGEQATYR